MVNPAVPARIRRLLNVESGLNDGIATPVVPAFESLTWQAVLYAVLSLTVIRMVPVALAGRRLGRAAVAFVG